MRDSKLPQAPGQQANGIVSKKREVLDSVVVRFAGDSGDGMQTAGAQFGIEAALAGKDISTFPDFPAEIRAPAGTTYGVSAFQINFGARAILTSGDVLDVLVAMNPAALKVNLADVKSGGLIVADEGTFTEKNLRKAGYASNPLEDGSLEPYRVMQVDMSRHTLDAVKSAGLNKKSALRCKNMWALGLIYWIFGRKRQDTVDWLNNKFAKLPEVAQGNEIGRASCRERV